MNEKTLANIKTALADSDAPWYGSDIIEWVAELLNDHAHHATEHQRYKKLESMCNSRYGELTAKLADAEREIATLSEIVRMNRGEREEALSKQLAAQGERVEELEDALSAIADGPEPINEYLVGIRCGVEDRNLQGDAYEAAEYGYQQGLEYCRFIADQALSTKPAEQEG